MCSCETCRPMTSLIMTIDRFQILFVRTRLSIRDPTIQNVNRDYRLSFAKSTNGNESSPKGITLCKSVASHREGGSTVKNAHITRG